MSNCVAACSRNADCKAYTFDKWNHACYLKATFTTLQAEPKSDSGVRKPHKRPDTAPEATRACRYPNSIFTGDVINSRPLVSVKACKDSCDGDSACVAYTFLTDSK